MPIAKFIGTNSVTSQIQSRLAVAEGLASRLAQIPLAKGQVRLFVPASLLEIESRWSRHEETQSVQGFRVCKVNRDEADQWFANYVKNYLSQSEQRFAIFQHSAAKPSDPFLASSRYPFFVDESHVYYFFTSRETNSEDILRARNLASAIQFIGILTSLPEGAESPKNRDTISPETLDKMVKATEQIIVSVSDGDTELVWSKNGRVARGKRSRPSS